MMMMMIVIICVRVSLVPSFSLPFASLLMNVLLLSLLLLPPISSPSSVFPLPPSLPQSLPPLLLQQRKQI